MSLGFDAVSQNGVSGAPHQATIFPLALAGAFGPASVFDYRAGDSTASGYTMARALAAYQTGSGGVLTLIATGTLRDGHYIGGVRTTLLEPSRTNWLLDSVDLTTGNWSAGSSGGPAAPTATAGQTADPAGTASAASKVVQPSVSIGGSFSVISQNPGGQGSVVKAFSVWLKGNAGGENYYVNATPNGTNYTRVLAVLTTAWAQYQVLTSTNNSQYAQIGTDLRDGSESATAAATVFAWCPQLEDGGYATSPIVNTSSARTRPADVLTFTVPGGSGQVGTLYEYYYDLATQAWVEQVSAYTTSSTYVPATGRAWARWAFALGTQTLEAMRALTTTSHLLAGALTSGKNVAGTTYTKSIAGGATPSGTLARKPLKVYGGGLTPTGALARKPLKLLVGPLTPSGTVIRKASKFLAGSLTPSGAVAAARAYARALAGAITPSGLVVKALAKTLAGALTSAGVVARTRSVTNAVSGAVTPTGSIVRRTARSVVGTLTPVGALARTLAKFVAGGLPLASALARSFSRSLAGAITPSGTITRSLARTLSGAISPAKAISKNIARLLGGALTPSGVASSGSYYSRLLSGAITPAGTIARAVARSLSGALTPTGAIARSITRAFTGSITPSATVAKKTARKLTGLLTTTTLKGTITKTLARTIVGSLLGPYAAFDNTTRPNSAALIGSAITGGPWINQGTIAWGITSNKGYSLQTSALVTQIITLSLPQQAPEAGLDFVTDAIQNHILTPILRFVDNSNYIGIGLSAGAVKLVVKVAAVANVRINIAQGASGNPLPATGASSGTVSATIDPAGNVAIYINSTLVTGATYTLTSTEITALLSSKLIGVQNQWVAASTNTASTFTNFYATTGMTVGALIRNAVKVLTAAITPAAAITRAIARLLSGTLTPSGIVTSGNRITSVLAGALAPSGSVVRGARKAIGGAFASSGALARRVGKSLVGSLSAGGVLAKAAYRILAGTLTPNAILSRVAVIHMMFGGALAPSGFMRAAARKALGGVLTPVGSVGRAFFSGARKLLVLFRAIR